MKIAEVLNDFSFILFKGAFRYIGEYMESALCYKCNIYLV